jgi:hypothetical protein
MPTDGPEPGNTLSATQFQHCIGSLGSLAKGIVAHAKSSFDTPHRMSKISQALCPFFTLNDDVRVYDGVALSRSIPFAFEAANTKLTEIVQKGFEVSDQDELFARCLVEMARAIATAPARIFVSGSTLRVAISSRSSDDFGMWISEAHSPPSA